LVSVLQQTTAQGRAYDLCFFNGFRESEKQQQILVSNLVSMKFELLVLVLCFLVSILWSKFLVGFFLFDGHRETEKRETPS
jgi:hypothetical protein